MAFLAHSVTQGHNKKTETPVLDVTGAADTSVGMLLIEADWVGVSALVGGQLFWGKITDENHITYLHVWD